MFRNCRCSFSRTPPCRGGCPGANVVPFVHRLEAFRTGRFQEYRVVLVGTVEGPAQPHLAANACLVEVVDSVRGLPLELDRAFRYTSSERLQPQQANTLATRVPVENLQFPPWLPRPHRSRRSFCASNAGLGPNAR